MSAKAKTSDLSHDAVVEAVDNLLATSQGRWSPRVAKGAMRQSGVDVFIPYSSSRMPFLLNKGKMLADGVETIASLSVFGSDKAGNVNRVSVDKLTPTPMEANSNEWWSIGLVFYDTVEQAKAAALVGVQEGIPTAYALDLGQNNEVAASAIQAIRDQEKPIRGLAAFAKPTPLVPDLSKCVVLCAPSGIAGDGESYWGNPPRAGSNASAGGTTPTANAGNGNGGEIEMA